MAQVGSLDFKGYVEGRKGERVGGAYGHGDSYAYVSDRNTRIAFEKMKPVELAVSATVRFFKNMGKSELLGHAVKVGPKQFPRVHDLGVRCAESLGIAPPTMYIVNHPTHNAATYGTNDDSFIMIHSKLVDDFTDEELLSVIGHECGHIHNNHVVYLTTIHYLRILAIRFIPFFPVVADAALLPLLGWLRRAEITCDRAGLLCCGSIDVSTRALAKLALGSAKLYNDLNMEAFLEQYDEGKDTPGRYAELRASHPWLPKRVIALKAFAESELFRKRSGAGQDGLTMQQVDDKVHEIIKIWG